MLKKVHHRFAVDDGSIGSAARDLEREGYCLVPRALGGEDLAELRREILGIFEHYPPDLRAGRASIEHAEMFRYEMFNRGPLCQALLGHRALLDVVEPLVGDDCHVIACTAWRNPGDPAHAPRGQEWHTDAGPHVPRAPGVPWPADIPYPVFAIAVHVFLDPCGPADGPTAVIPGSHMSGLAPPKEREFDLVLEHAGRGPVSILAEPGDASFFVSDAWHRRLPPRTGGRGRFFLQINYARRDIAQRVRPTSVVNHASRAARERALTERQRLLIGLHPERFYDG